MKNRFEWLENMEYDRAQKMMLLYHPYFLYPYYLNGKNVFTTDDLNPYRIHVRVENDIIILVNGYG